MKYDRIEYNRKRLKNYNIIQKLYKSEVAGSRSLACFFSNPEKSMLRFASSLLDYHVDLEQLREEAINNNLKEVHITENVALKLLIEQTKRERKGKLLSKKEFDEIFGDMEGEEYLDFLVKLVYHTVFSLFSDRENSNNYYCKQLELKKNRRNELIFNQMIILLSSSMIAPIMNLFNGYDEDEIENFEYFTTKFHELCNKVIKKKSNIIHK